MAREALEVLKECEAFLEGHFLLSSGRHSGAYCQMAFLQQYPDKAAEVMAPVAEKLKELNIDVVTKHLRIFFPKRFWKPGKHIFRKPISKLLLLSRSILDLNGNSVTSPQQCAEHLANRMIVMS